MTRRILRTGLVVAAAVLIGACSDSSTTEPTIDVAPVVLSTTPLHSATGVARNISVTATFDVAMLASSINETTFVLLDGSTPVPASVSLAGTVATLIPASELEADVTYTAQLTTGVKNAAGVALAADETWDFTTMEPAPVLRSTFPLNSATGVARDVSVTATFDVAMLASSIDETTFVLMNGSTAVPGTVSLNDTIATLVPASELNPDVTYTAQITTGAKNEAGVPLEAIATWEFTTIGSAPIVLSTTPLNSATGVVRNVSVTATFDGAMEASSIDETTFILLNGSTAVSSSVSLAGTVATLIPAVALEPNATYTAQITTGARNAAGVALAADETWNFTTVATSVTGPQAVNLGTAGNYVILAKTAISTTGSTSVVGDLGLSPAAATFITGFSLSSPPTTSTTSALVTGSIWASDYDPPTPANLTTAVLDMQTAFADAAGRVLPDFNELGAGSIEGMTLTPGLYKWGTGVSFTSGVTLEGGADDIWIFQIAEDLTVGNGAIVTLSGGAQAKNVFWQVAGQTTLGTTSDFKGIILSQTLIALNTGATVTGRLLAQTAVTLDASAVVSP